MSERIKIRGVFKFQNGMCAVTDMNGQQVPDFQGKWEESKEKLKGGNIDTSHTEWFGVPFDERMEIEATVK